MVSNFIISIFRFQAVNMMGMGVDSTTAALSVIGRISKFYFYVGAIVAVNSKGEYGMSIACTVFNSYKATTSTVKKWLYKRDSLQRGSLLVFVISLCLKSSLIRRVSFGWSCLIQGGLLCWQNVLRIRLCRHITFVPVSTFL